MAGSPPPADHRYDTYADVDVDRYLGVARTPETRLTVVYGRVSSRARQNDLRSQRKSMETFCLGASMAVDAWLTDMGGGLHFKHPVFRSLMERGKGRGIGFLPVAHQDRLIPRASPASIGVTIPPSPTSTFPTPRRNSGNHSPNPRAVRNQRDRFR